jgi:hypothetical protein
VIGTAGPQISPMPTDEEAVAIAAAIEFAWPRVLILESVIAPAQPAAWRYSGRWWNAPLPLRRQRP